MGWVHRVLMSFSRERWAERNHDAGMQLAPSGTDLRPVTGSWVDERWQQHPDAERTEVLWVGADRLPVAASKLQGNV